MINLYTFVRPNFFFGASRVLDLGAKFSKFNLGMNSKEIDALSILSDWSIVGEDIKESFLKIDTE